MEMEKWRWRNGDGDMEIETWKWRHGNMETLTCDMETWRHGDMDTWTHGHMDAWRHGHMDMET
jgi:hypothetical protein